MSEKTTLARPYAKAIFEYAKAINQLPQWSEILFALMQTGSSKEATDFINNPSATTEQRIQLLMVTNTLNDPKSSEALKNLVTVLANNFRLALLPEIVVLYEQLRADQEKTLEAKVVSFAELSPKQQAELEQSLSKRLQRKVSLQMMIDSSLLGGAIITAGDLVIDGSVRGKLNKLRAVLAA